MLSDQQTLKGADLEVYPRSPAKLQKSVTFEEDSSSSLVTALDIVQDIEALGLSKPAVFLPPIEENKNISNTALMGDSPSEVLNKISHDLDYLLNRTPSPTHRGSPQKSLSSRRKNSLPDRTDVSSTFLGKTEF